MSVAEDRLGPKRVRADCKEDKAIDFLQRGESRGAVV